SSLVVDTTAPSAPGRPDLVVADDTGSSSSDDRTNKTTFTVSVAASESGGTTVVTATRNSTTVQCSFASSTSGATCSLSGLSEGTWTVTATNTDFAGNQSTASTSLTVVIDTTAPTVSITPPSSPTRTLQYSVVGSEPLTGVIAGDFSATAGCTVGLTTIDASNYTVNLTGCAEGTISLSLTSGSVTDTAGNATASAFSAGVVTLDTTAPSVSSFSAGATSNIRTFTYSLVFAEPIAGLATGDFTNVGTAGACTFTPDAASGTSFTISVSCPQDGTVIARLVTGSVADVAGNNGPSVVADSTTVTIFTGATTLVVTTPPSGAASGAAFASQPVVELRNDAGQTVTGQAAVVTASVTQISGTGVLVGTQTASVDTNTGAATFSNLGLTGTAGTSYTVTFTSTVNGSALSPATSSVAVSVGTPTHLAVTTQPVGQGAGASLANQPVVEVRDSGGNLVTSSSASVVASATSGTLGGTTTISAQAGVATFSDLTFAGTAGANYTLTFTSTGLSAATSSNFTVTVGAATKLVLTTTAANAQYAQAFSTQPVVEVQDAGSNRVASSHTVTATLSSGVVVGTSSSSLDADGTSGEVTFSGLGITGLPGSYSITYSSSSLASTSQNITLNKAAQTISFADPSDATYSATPFGLSGTSSSGLTVTFSTLSPAICSVSGSDVTMLSSGTCRIAADQSGDDYFEPASRVTQEVNIGRSTPSLSWADVTKTFGDAPFTVTPPTASVPGIFTYVSSDLTTATVNGDEVTVMGGGTSTITATFTPTDTGKYVSGEQVTMLLTVNRSTQQSLTLTSTSGVYGNPLILTVSGGDTNGAVSFAVADGTASGCSEANGELVSSSRGTCTVTATMAADRDYLSVTTQPTTVTLSARPITVTADPKDRHYGEFDPLFSYQITSGSLVNGDTLSGTLDRVAGGNVGRYAIGQGSLDNDDYDIDFVSDDLEITRRPVTATAGVASKFYGDADPSLSYTITNGTLVTGESLTGVLDRSAGETVGTYAIGQGTLTNANNPNYAITFVSADFSVDPRPITVTAIAASKRYSMADPVFTFTVTGGNLVNGDQLTGVLDRANGEDVGDYSIGQGTVTDANNPNYAITFVGANFEIDPRPITVTADPQRITYGDSDPTFTYVVGGDGLKTGDVLTGALARVAGANAGQHVIVQGTLDNPNYEITFNGAYLTIDPKPIMVTADDVTITYGDPEPTLTVSASVGDLVGGDVLNGVPARDAGTDAGTYAIRQGGVTNANNPNYDIMFVEGTLTIQQAAQAPLAIVQSDKIYGVDLSLTYTGGSGDGSATFSVSSSGTAGCTISGSVLSSTGGVGTTCVVRLDKDQSNNFSPASTTTTVTVQPREITVAVDSPVKIYGDPDPTFTYTITSGSLADGDQLLGSPARASGEDVGTYAISQGTLGHPDYLVTVVPGLLTIDERPITISADDTGKMAGDQDPAFTYTVTSGTLVGGDQLSGSLIRSSGELIGSYVIDRGTLDNSNYDIMFVPGTFTISGVSQSALTLVVDTNPIVRGDSADLSVTGGDGVGAVTYTIVSESTPGVCTLVVDPQNSTAVVTGTLAGSCTIVADKASDGTYDPAQSQVVTVVVNKAPQSITFVSPGDQNYSTTPFLVSPTASSGMSVDVVSTTTSVCTVNGYQVQMLFSGTCEVVASVPEGANYLAAANVAVQFEVVAVLPSPPTVSALTATSDSIAVTFEAGDHGGEIIVGYEYSLDSGATWTAFPAGSITSPIMITGVNSSTTYDVSMRAVTSVGASPSSNSMSIATQAPPQTFNGGAVTSSTVVTTTSTTTTTTTTIVTSTTIQSSTSAPSRTQSTITTSTVRVTTSLADDSTTTERVTTTVVQEVDGSESTPAGESEVDSVSAPEPIDVETGESMAIRDGELLEMEWRAQETGGAITSWDEVTLGVVSGVSPEQGDPLLPDGTIAVEKGMTVHVDVVGLRPASPMEGWLFSEPTLLGVRDIGPDGSLTTSFVVPESIGVGAHTLQLKLVEYDGTATEVAIGVVVLDEIAAIKHRNGELNWSTIDVLVAPTVVEVVEVDRNDSALLALWLILVLVLVVAIGRLPMIRPRRLPDGVSYLADDADWSTRLGVARWLLPIAGFVLGAWASADTQALPVPPTTVLMLLLLVVGVLDPLAGSIGSASFLVAVTVGGGVSSAETLASLIVVAALWCVPTLVGSAASRAAAEKFLTVTALIRVAITTSMFVAMVELLPSFTSIRTTTNLYVTELAWVVAIVSLVRAWLDRLAGEMAGDRRSPRFGPVWALLGIVSLVYVVVNSGGLSAWNTAGLVLLAAVTYHASRRNGVGGTVRRGGFAVGSVVVLTGVALGGASSPPSIQPNGVETAATVGTVIGDIVVDVDSYPEVFEVVSTPDHGLVVANDELGVRLVMSSILENGERVPLEAGNLRLVIGQHLDLVGEGLASRSEIETWLFSTPRQLGVGKVESNGRVVARFDVPDDQLAGRHDLRMRIVLSSGRSALISIPVDVVASVPLQSF
ncbi:MAG: hypothetical protein RLZ04_1702, partial [Actinomycetota bacterium]